MLNADNPQYPRLAALAEAAGCARVIGFGAAEGAAARLVDVRLDAQGSDVAMALDGRELAFRIGAPGRALGEQRARRRGVRVRARRRSRGGGARARRVHPAGRARPRSIGSPCRAAAITLIDDSYNANPASLARRAARARQRAPGASSPRSATCSSWASTRRACTPSSPSRSPPAASTGSTRRAPRCVTCTRLCRPNGAARHVDDAASLVPVLQAELRPGDTLLVKGSLGMRMGRIVEALLAERAPARRVGARGR